jgi:hypothetical protein
MLNKGEYRVGMDVQPQRRQRGRLHQGEGGELINDIDGIYNPYDGHDPAAGLHVAFEYAELTGKRTTARLPG